MYKYVVTERFVYGVPRRDLSEQEWRKLTDRQREAARLLYVRTSKQKQEAENVQVEDETPPEFETSTDQPEDSTQTQESE